MYGLKNSQRLEVFFLRRPGLLLACCKFVLQVGVAAFACGGRQVLPLSSLNRVVELDDLAFDLQFAVDPILQRLVIRDDLPNTGYTPPMLRSKAAPP